MCNFAGLFSSPPNRSAELYQHVIVLGQVSQCYRQAALGLAVQWEDALPWLLRQWALCRLGQEKVLVVAGSWISQALL